METKSLQIIQSFDSQTTHHRKTVVKSSVELVGDCDENQNDLLYAKPKTWQLLCWDQLPDWMKDNEFIRGWYRPPLNSYDQCFWSVFRVHNQTTNIWTHVLAALAFNYMYMNYIPDYLTKSDDRLAFSLIPLGIILSFYSSAIFHTFVCHSEGMAAKFVKLDYMGITIHIFGNNFGLGYFIFYCDQYRFVSFMTFATIFCICCLIINNLPHFNGSGSLYRTARTIIFFMFGFASIVPQMHWFSVTNSLQTNHSLHLLVAMDVCYLVGAVVYATRVPERFLIGKCDLIHSHMCFHILTSMGSYFCYKSIAEIAFLRSRQSSCGI